MSSRVEFRDGPTGIVPVVDGIELTTLGGGGWAGLNVFEARIVARMLQGWEPPPLEHDPDEFLEKGEPFEGAPGWYGYSPEPVPLRLPGGDEPEVDSWHLGAFRDREGVPLAACSCGGGVGCAALYVRITSSDARDQVSWAVGYRRFVFDRTQYDRAICELLELVGETPRLLTDPPAV